MEKLTLLSLIILFVSTSAQTSPSAQYWAKTYGGNSYDSAYSIQQTIDGGFIVAGQTSSFGSGGLDSWILKLDRNGNLSWQKTYGETEWDSFTSIQQTLDGGYIMAGYIGYPLPPEKMPILKNEDVSTCSGIWVVKLTDSGNVFWQNCYGMTEVDKPTAINQTSDGGYILVGNTHYTSFTDIWVLKLDSNGNISWQKSYGGNKSDSAYSIQQTKDGGYVVAGKTDLAASSSSDFLVLKLDNSGNVSWQKIYKVSVFGSVHSCSIQQTADEGYILAGDAGEPLNNVDIYLLKLSSNGDIIWQKTYRESDWDDEAYFSSIQQTSDGGYILAGIVVNNAGYKNTSDDLWLLKLDIDGNLIWRNVYDVSYSDSMYSAQQTSDGGYILAADTLGAGYKDILIMKLDSNGEIPFCDIVSNSTVIVSDTDMDFEDSTVTVQSTSATITETNIIPQDSLAEITTICGGVGPCLVERIYGEYSEGTKIIRNFRNDVLSQTLIGQELISLYYQWSPTIVKAMEEDEEFKEQVKKLTDTILLLLNERLDVSN